MVCLKINSNNTFIPYVFLILSSLYFYCGVSECYVTISSSYSSNVHQEMHPTVYVVL
jgi:hypothetical protein